MLAITAELKRILKPTGTLWWNHGESYGGSTGSGSNQRNPGKQTSPVPVRSSPTNTRNKAAGGVPKLVSPNKCLLMQPYRLAIRMIDEQGWILRNQIIWHKPNCMPSSAQDRFTVDFEPVLFFTKSKKYWFERQLEPTKPYSMKFPDNWDTGSGSHGSFHRNGREKGKQTGIIRSARSKRTTWKIPTHPFPEAHFATFPPELVEIPIKAGCPKDGIVLDPFAGSGTTLYVARQLGRKYVGIELNPEYIKIAENRLSQQVFAA